MKKTLIIIPAYNEELNIERVVKSLREENPDWFLFVVNDCSSDKTANAAKEAGCDEVADLPCNLGIGGAVQTGLIYAAREGFDQVVKFDGDGQHVAGEIKRLLDVLDSESVDVAIGSRFCENRDNFKSTLTRRIGIKVFEFINSALISQRITDNTSGFRAYNRKAIEFLARHYPSFDYPEPEEVVLLGKNGFKLQEVFTEMRERNAGKSSISPHRSVYYMIKVLLAIFMVALRPKITR